MTDVFISYAREDQGVARLVADAVRHLGYRVWWDEDLPAHVRYGDVIAERIKSARAVIVLWSRHAIASEWVRAEADGGREARKLIQAALDPVAPPMPFNQIQVVTLAGWQGEPGHPGWRKVQESLAMLAPLGAAAPAGPAPAPPATAPPRGGFNMTMMGALLIALVVLAAIAIGLMVFPADHPAAKPDRIARRGPPVRAGPPIDFSRRDSGAPPAAPVDIEAGAPPVAPVPPTPTAGSPGEIIPGSSQRRLTPSDLAGLNRAQLRLARNEIYARRGRIFQDPALQSYFSRFPWYRPIAEEVALSPVEQANVSLIQAFEGH